MGSTINVTVKFGKEIHELNDISTQMKVVDIKARLEHLTSVPASMQKLMFKGMLKDDDIIENTNVKDGCKIMLIGSTIDNVISVNTRPQDIHQVVSDFQEEKKESKPMCQEMPHKKYLAAGPPKDAIPGEVGTFKFIEGNSISGILGHTGKPVRLTFKNDQDMLWIASNDRTEKIPYATIRSIIDYPINDHPGYCILSLQLGSSEKSKFNLYFVPRQFIRNIRRTIMGL